MEQICKHHPDLSDEEALSTAMHTFNSREQIRGFSPIQHAFGRNPDVTGRLFRKRGQVSGAVLVESLDPGQDDSDGGTPWTYNKVVEEIGGNQYEDVKG